MGFGYGANRKSFDSEFREVTGYQNLVMNLEVLVVA